MNIPLPKPEKILPLTPAVFHILLALADKERHGYAIMQEVAVNSHGQINMGPGTLYGTVKRLLAAGMIEETDERPDPDLDDERRRYYRLTGYGRQVFSDEVERLERLVQVAQAKQRTSEKSPRFQGGAGGCNLDRRRCPGQGDPHRNGSLDPYRCGHRHRTEPCCGRVGGGGHTHGRSGVCGGVHPDPGLPAALFWVPDPSTWLRENPTNTAVIVIAASYISQRSKKRWVLFTTALILAAAQIGVSFI